MGLPCVCGVTPCTCSSALAGPAIVGYAETYGYPHVGQLVDTDDGASVIFSVGSDMITTELLNYRMDAWGIAIRPKGVDAWKSAVSLTPDPAWGRRGELAPPTVGMVVRYGNDLPAEIRDTTPAGSGPFSAIATGYDTAGYPVTIDRQLWTDPRLSIVKLPDGYTYGQAPVPTSPPPVPVPEPTLSPEFWANYTGRKAR